jgi:excisionase family DNA binding protein
LHLSRIFYYINLALTFAVAKAQNARLMGDFLTVSQAADEIGITRQAVQQLIDSERLYAVWMLERWAIPAAEVKKYKREKEKRSTIATSTNGNSHQ